MNNHYKNHERVLNRIRDSVLFFGCLLALVTGAPEAFSQSALNAGGGSGKISGDAYAFSIGEMTRIQTASGVNLIVTEGLLQPTTEEGSGIASQSLSPEALQVFPNPVPDVLTLQPRLQQGGILHCRLTDIQGRLLFQKEYILLSGNEEQRIDVSGLAAGNYLLHATVSQGAKQYASSFKIQKLR